VSFNFFGFGIPFTTITIQELRIKAEDKF